MEFECPRLRTLGHFLPLPAAPPHAWIMQRICSCCEHVCAENLLLRCPLSQLKLGLVILENLVGYTCNQYITPLPSALSSKPRPQNNWTWTLTTARIWLLTIVSVSSCMSPQLKTGRLLSDRQVSQQIILVQIKWLVMLQSCKTDPSFFILFSDNVIY